MTLTRGIDLYLMIVWRLSKVSTKRRSRFLKYRRLRRRYSSTVDDSVTTLGVLSVLSVESTRLGTTPHTVSMSVSPSMDTPPTHLLASSSSDRSHTVSPIRLVSISPVTPARPDVSHSPYSSGNLTVAAVGLGVVSVTSDSVRVSELN